MRSTGPRSLGQNFLVDRNILGVMERLAELGPEDVVLEIGGGLGILSAHLAARSGYLHVVEVDRNLEPELKAALAGATNASIEFGDVLELDLRSLSPAPGKVVANLPYAVAASALLRTIDELPSVQRWVVMVQREVGERLAAAPATAAYGIPSVLAQLACEVRVLRPVSRQVFRPVPNVDSVLVGLRRRGPAASREVSALVHDAFAHRRKTLVGSVALADRRLDGSARERIQRGLAELGHPVDARAERLAPEDFRRLAEVALA